MSRIPRTALLVLLLATVSVATATSAVAKPWPGDPAPKPPPTWADTGQVADQAAAGASPLWHFLLVAAATALVAGVAAYFVASRRRDSHATRGASSLEVSGLSLG